MKINFNISIPDLDGAVLKEDGKEVTLGRILVRALITPYQDEQTLSLDEKFERGHLANRIKESTGPIEIKSEDQTRLKNVIGKYGTPWIVFNCLPLIDPAEKCRTT